MSDAADGVSLQSQNYQDYYITHEDGLVKIEHIAENQHLIDAATWVVGNYQQVRHWKIFATKLLYYFRIRIWVRSILGESLWPDENGETYSLCVPTNRNFCLRHQNYRLKMQENDDSDLFAKDASFNVRVAGKHGHWNDIHCEVEFPAVCQFLPYGEPKPTLEWPVNGGRVQQIFLIIKLFQIYDLKRFDHSYYSKIRIPIWGCPIDWYQFAGNCYFIPVQTNTAEDLAKLRTFQKAQEECQNLDASANLAIIINKFHNSFLSSLFVDMNPISRPYIGVESTVNDQTFVYPTHVRIQYSNWAANQPSRAPDTERSGILNMIVLNVWNRLFLPLRF